MNHNELAKWWEIQGSHYSMANSLVSPYDQAVILSLESKYEEDFQRNLRKDVYACDNDFLERWSDLKVLKNVLESDDEDCDHRVFPAAKKGGGQNIKLEIKHIKSSVV